MTDSLTLDALLEMKRRAKEAKSAIRCAVCDTAGVADQPDTVIFFMQGGGAVYLHKACADDPNNWVEVPPSIRQESEAE